ncbi:MAG TPA: DUF6789 family protein [Anaeromyxobacteraceae bacterium]|nr:DUF6789 family protein [Anaeromyxobacteraceae bacterium]
MVARVGTLNEASALAHAVGRRGAVASGIASGLLGGAAMALFLAAAASAAGVPARQVLEAIGTTFVGAGGLGGAERALYGAALHALVAVAAGLAYTAVVPRDLPPASAAVVGVGYALFLAGIMTSVVVPLVNPGFREAAQPIGGSWVMAHAVYGAVLGLWYARRGRAAGGPANEP